jgi:alpha,alpha-trehalose phosphorylase
VADNRALLGYRCANSGMTLAVGTDHQIETENEYELLTEVEEDYAKYIFRSTPCRATRSRSPRR